MIGTMDCGKKWGGVVVVGGGAKDGELGLFKIDN